MLLSIYFGKSNQNSFGAANHYFATFFSFLSGAHDAPAAVDGQRLAGDEGRAAGGQEHDGLGHLERLTHPAHGVSLHAVLQEVRVPWRRIGLMLI